MHYKENAPIYMFYVAPNMPMMSSVIADCPALAPPQYFGQVYACVQGRQSWGVGGVATHRFWTKAGTKVAAAS